MSKFPELVLKEYESISKRSSPSKESYYRIRVVKRKNAEGLFVQVLDIRKFIVNERKALFTEEGIYLDRENLSKLIDVLQVVKKEFF